MPTLDITDDHRDRIETLREELAAAHAGEYASVGTADTLNYLLDLAEVVDDPGRAADSEAIGRDAPVDGEDAESAASAISPFDRETAHDRLEARNRKHGDPDDEAEMDLYTIAATFDVTGRSDMTKGELIEAILDEAERLTADPFARVDIDLGGSESDGESEAAEEGSKADEDRGTGTEDDTDGETDAEEEGNATDATSSAAGDAGSSQLNAMMSLLDTHDDKWHEADGDARYEVELPDGHVETARTKDDVRALLFKNY